MSIEIDWLEYAVEGAVKGTDERIKVIDGYPAYFVTTKGRVFSAKLNDGTGDEDYNQLREKSQRFTNSKGNKPYYRVEIFANGKRKTINTHILVARAFIPNPKNLPIVNHLKYPSNKVEDLEWNTQQGNCEHGASSKYHLIQFPDGSIKKIRSLSNFIKTVVTPGISQKQFKSYMNNFKSRKTPLNGYKFIKTLDS